MTNLIAPLGIIGLYMVEVSYLPQIWRLYRLKEAEEFSFSFPALNIVGRLCGLAFSVSQGNSVFGWFFVVGIVLRATLLGQVVYYRLRKKRVAPTAERTSQAMLDINAVPSP